MLNPCNIIVQGEKVRFIVHAKTNAMFRKPKLILDSVFNGVEQLIDCKNGWGQVVDLR